MPKGLDLDAWINEPPKEEEEPEETASDGFDFLSHVEHCKSKFSVSPRVQPFFDDSFCSAESKKDSEKASAAREKSAAAARLRRSQDPFYINDRSFLIFIKQSAPASSDSSSYYIDVYRLW